VNPGAAARYTDAAADAPPLADPPDDPHHLTAVQHGMALVVRTQGKSVDPALSESEHGSLYVRDARASGARVTNVRHGITFADCMPSKRGAWNTPAEVWEFTTTAQRPGIPRSRDVTVRPARVPGVASPKASTCDVCGASTSYSHSPFGTIPIWGAGTDDPGQTTRRTCAASFCAYCPEPTTTVAGTPPVAVIDRVAVCSEHLPFRTAWIANQSEGRRHPKGVDKAASAWFDGRTETPAEVLASQIPDMNDNGASNG
jgi:hypothetical protein